MVLKLATAMLMGTCAAGLCAAVPAQAQSADVRHRFDIPPGSLKTTLERFARETGVQLIYRSDEVSEVPSPGARGVMSREGALEALLKETGFLVRTDTSGAFAIIRAPKATTLRARLEKAAAVQPQQQVPIDRSSILEVASDEIIVTAQKRDERLQDVPLTVVSISGDRLTNSGIIELQSLGQAVSGLKFEKYGAYMQPSIRGVSTLVTQASSEANIALYVDGVYQPSMIGNSFDLPDLARVEVLKGPQGTLFGRNASGGAVQLFTKDPSLNEPRADVTFSYGELNEVAVRGTVDGPIVQNTVGLSISGIFQQRNSYNRNVADGNKRTDDVVGKFLRGKLLVRPSDWLDITLMGHYMEKKDSSSYEQTVINNNNVSRNTPGVVIPRRPGQTSFNPDLEPVIDVQTWSAALRADADVGFADLRYIGSYGETRSILDFDRDATNANLIFFFTDQPQDYWSHEVNLISKSGGRLDWTIGAYLFGFDDHYKLTSVGLQVLINQLYETRSQSIFGELTFHATDRLSITAGGRYSIDKKRRVNGVTGDLIDRRRYRNFTPRLSIRYELNNNVNAYATFSQGIKTGIFDNFSPAVARPEKVKSYEVGIKGDIRPIRFNVAGFYYDYKDLQVQSIRDNIVLLQNAANSEIYGLDTDIDWRVLPELSLNAAVVWLHARYKSYPGGQINVPLPTGGNAAAIRDLSGNTNIRAPEWNIILGANYEKDFTFGTVTASVNYAYTSKYFVEAGNRVVQPSYDILSGRITWQPKGSPITFGVWGRNLTNADYPIGLNINTSGDTLSYAAPRQIGGEIRFRF